MPGVKRKAVNAKKAGKENKKPNSPEHKRATHDIDKVEPNTSPEDASQTPLIKEIKKEASVEKEVKKRSAKKIAAGETEEQAELRKTVGKGVLDTVGNSKKMLGYHVSAAGSVETAIYNAVSTGCRAFALFVRNQRTWNAKPMEEEKIVRWKAAMEETKFDVNQILPHGSYLINPGTCDPEKLEKSRGGMLDECKRCEQLGLKLYNFHPGSAVGHLNTKDCIKVVGETINYIIKNTEYITLVIETMAKQGQTVGGTFREIRDMIDLVEDKSRIGVCIDTCHIFAAGYDIRSKIAYEKTMKEFEDIIGFKYLKGLHLNDSKGELGCKADRHEHIGSGKIGKKGFEHIMADSRLNGIPLILETPEGRYPEEMKLLYKMDPENQEKSIKDEQL